MNDPLWSAKTLLEDPCKIQDVHEAYLSAGADIITTASYQASVQGFKRRGLNEHETLRTIRNAVNLAWDARESLGHREPGRRMLIAGSVGPYGAFLADGSEYRGDYQVSQQALEEFHLPRIHALLAGSVDVLAFETLPSAPEVLALLDILDVSSEVSTLTEAAFFPLFNHCSVSASWVHDQKGSPC